MYTFIYLYLKKNQQHSTTYSTFRVFVKEHKDLAKKDVKEDF